MRDLLFEAGGELVSGLGRLLRVTLNLQGLHQLANPLILTRRALTCTASSCMSRRGQGMMFRFPSKDANIEIVRWAD